MKKLLAFLLLTHCQLAVITSHAQIAHWIVPPTYDVIKATPGQNMVIVDSANTSMLMTTDGKCLVKSTDVLHAVGDDMAVATKPSTQNITGYYTLSGTFKPLQGYRVAHQYPRYSGGNLLVKEANDYLYLDVDGKVVCAAAEAYPFFHGLAACKKYASPDKRKNPTWCLVSGDMQPSPIQLKGSNVSPSDIDYISSLNAEGKCLVIVKNQLYLFSDADWNLTPLTAADDPKSSVKLIGNIEDYITPATIGPVTLKAQSKKGELRITLNAHFILQSIQGAGIDKSFSTASNDPDPTSSLSIYERGGKKGINYKDTEILAPQFDLVELCANNRAAVNVGDKCGIIAIDPKAQFDFTFNDGAGLAFRHQKLRTTLRLDTPPHIPLTSATLQSSADGTIQFDPTSKRSKDTPDGNALQYNCTLTIPDDLPDDATPITIPVQVRYEGLLTAPIPVPTQAWHYKYFTINVHEGKSIFSNGNVTFTFGIKAERLPGEKDVPHTVSVQSAGHKSTLDKVSESLYRCQVFGLTEGTPTPITVQVTETGCPPSSYTFSVTYQKPQVQKSSAGHTGIRIVNTTKANPKPVVAPPTKPNRPKLDI